MESNGEGMARHKDNEDCEDDRVDRDDTNKQSRTNNKQWGETDEDTRNDGEQTAEGTKAMGRGWSITHKTGPNDVYHRLGPRQVFMFVSYFLLSTNLSRYCRFYSCSSNTTTCRHTQRTTHYPLPPSPIYSCEQLLAGWNKGEGDRMRDCHHDQDSRMTMANVMTRVSP
jgi:hypothetical protein